jgi:hypothetical protein
LETTETIIEAMELFLYKAGKETFERVFKWAEQQIQTISNRHLPKSYF